MKKTSSKVNWLKRILITLGILLLLTVILVPAANYYVVNQSRNSLYNSIDSIPYNKVGLVLGTSKYVSKGVPNLFYQNRMDAALALYLTKKVKYLILSGDNGTMAYNEPKTMKKDLMAAGIPDSVLFLDYAGFRTLDAVVRAKAIFGQTSVTIVSQSFHNYRAVYLAKHNDINAIAYNAPEVPFSFNPYTFYREYFARVKAVLDVYIFRTQPKFLGDKIVIPG